MVRALDCLLYESFYKLQSIFHIVICIFALLPDIFILLLKVLLQYTRFKLEPAQNSPMDFNIIKLKRISEFITVGKLKTHEPDRNKEIESEPYTVKLGFHIQRFIIELPVLPENIKKCLASDEVTVF